MKTSRFALLVLLSPLLSLRADPVDSRITAATVYGDRAMVTRTATLDLSVGEHALVFERLPASLIDQSIQASGRGVAGATILDVNAQTAYVDFTPNARVKEMEDQLRALQRQQRALDDRAQILGEQRDFVKRMVISSTTPPAPAAESARTEAAAPRPSLEEWQKIFSYSGDTLGKIAGEIQQVDEQREEIKAKESALEQQLNELRSAGSKSFKTVTVRVSMASAGKLELSLRYGVPGASWSPAYDARLRAADRAVDLSYFGIVRNATGEDWNGISLTLSTARPGLGGAAPELRPWVVDVARIAPMDMPDEMRREKAMKTMAVQQFNVAAPAAKALRSAGKDAEIQDAGYFAATVESGATSATFAIPGVTTLPGNNIVQKVAISTARLAASLQYQSTPKAMETAFLTAYAVNTTGYPFLAGAMNSFLDDTFVAAAHLKTIMPGEKFELALGADEGIAVKRKLVNRFSEDTGLTSKGRRVTYEYLLTVANNKKTAERVVFKEPIPVSRNEKIEVALITPAPRDLGTKDKPGEVALEEDGKLVWRLDLKPGEKREIPVKFSVEHPADLNVSGLE